MNNNMNNNKNNNSKKHLKWIYNNKIYDESNQILDLEVADKKKLRKEEKMTRNSL